VELKIVAINLHTHFLSGQRELSKDDVMDRFGSLTAAAEAIAFC
jgi:hypothetical protein